MCAGITTFLPLHLYAEKGQRVAIVGAGGLGHFGIQFAKKMGCTVDVFSSSHKKDDMIKKLGGEEIILWTEGELKNKRQHYDLILNTLPLNLDKDQFLDMIKCLKPYGKFAQVGVGEVNTNDLQIPVDVLVSNNLMIVGSLVGGLQHYKDMLEFVDKHGIESICEHYDFEDFPKALDKLENGRPIFRCVVDTEKYSDKYKSKDQ